MLDVRIFDFVKIRKIFSQYRNKNSKILHFIYTYQYNDVWVANVQMFLGQHVLEGLYFINEPVCLNWVIFYYDQKNIENM